MESDIFQEVSRKEIHQLLQLFRAKLENYYPLCQYVEIMKEYDEKGVKNPCQSIYRYGKEEDGVYLFEAYFNLGESSYSFFHIYTASKEFMDLKEALSRTERVPWLKSNYEFESTFMMFAPVVSEVARNKGINIKTAEDLLWLPPDQHLEVSKVPGDLDLKFLDQSHAELMDRQWTSRFPGSDKYLAIQIANNFGLDTSGAAASPKSVEMDQDILEKVPQKDINKLLEVFKQDVENYYPFCQYVEIMEEYNKASVTVPEQSLYRYGRIEDGVYLFKSHFDFGDITYTLFHLFTAAKDLSDLEKALSETERIPWSTSSYMFQVTWKRLAPVVRNVATAKGVKLSGVEEDLLWLPSDHHLEESKVPEDLDLKFLDQRHAQLMDDQWKFNFPGSNKYLGIQVKNNFGLGLFRKCDGKMVSCGIAFNSGGIFCLITDPDSRGKGYAEIIVRRLAKELRHRRKIPFATAQRENIPPQRVFRKIGFKDFRKIEYIIPPNHYKEYKPASVD